MRRIAIVFLLSTFHVYAATQNVIHLNHAVAKTNVVMSGIIHADHGNFEGDLKITSNDVVMSASVVKGNMTILSDKKTPIVVLSHGTQIFGDIIFQGVPGILKKSADSRVKGKVINGAIKEIKIN